VLGAARGARRSLVALVLFLVAAALTVTVYPVGG
jgi:hypothetical protein